MSGSGRAPAPSGGASGNVAGNYYDKYNTKNPVEKFLVRRFMGRVVSTFLPVGAESVLEVGCGEGNVAGALKAESPGTALAACDLSLDIVARARTDHPDVPFFAASAYELPFPADSFDMVVACEVLEHLDDPDRALAEMLRVTRAHLLVSVPCEPLWRLMNVMRGKYLAELGNTPGHVQHWSKRGLAGFLGRRCDVLEVHSPLPWSVCLCRKRR